MPVPSHRKTKFTLTPHTLKETISLISDDDESRSMLASIYQARDGYLKIYKNGICVETELIGSFTKLHSILSTNQNFK